VVHFAVMTLALLSPRGPLFAFNQPSRHAFFVIEDRPAEHGSWRADAERMPSAQSSFVTVQSRCEFTFFVESR
jgi:hypothetical protein